MSIYWRLLTQDEICQSGRRPAGAASAKLSLQPREASGYLRGSKVHRESKRWGHPLPVRVQQALDGVRVTGNNAVHPGQIEMDSGEAVSQLFVLVNLIGEYMISMPKRVSDLYDGLPREDRLAGGKVKA